ncbi:MULTISPECIES: DUF1501 domain-containing protein [unclassified Novosphingobium]|uniref:DUF1501 domain-containing protein n=1 Tax=unclassified Novosphingobium TaxID=2644732 RepID=UPI0025D07A19|nr:MULTISPECIES: DUF1501 domain-containing protein [unclassified Novosphingobium]HQV03957.1 DUF1501 domain-containing protein [Novosphingobium sp.]
MFDRRQILIGGAAATLFAPRIAFARAETERRLVFLIQRGAADGLATLAPTGDPAYAGLRGDLAADLMSQPKLGGLFALHPALKQLGAMYGSNQALFAHAVASPYRDRSHFDGQNVLETGGALPYDRKDGWMNRLIGLLPGGPRGLAISATVPTALRGDVQVASYAPSNLPDAPQDLLQRVTMLYEGDPQLHGLWNEALQTRAMAADLSTGNVRGAAAAGQLIASLMTGAEGARIVMAESNGWDTHAGQRARLNNQLTGLDAMLASLREGLGPAWSETLVVVATEFGRTAAVNGTGGTDHGTGSLAMLLGGTVAGGRILSDWPGLGPSQLYEGRDLKPTLSIDALLAGALAEHFRIDPAQAAPQLFPGGAGKPISGLIRA